jgi:hypothetical protein
MDANRHEKGTPGALPRLRGAIQRREASLLVAPWAWRRRKRGTFHKKNVGGVAGVWLANLRYSPHRQSGGQFASNLTFAYCCLKLF